VSLEVRIREQIPLQSAKKNVKKTNAIAYKTEYGKSFHAKDCGYLHNSKQKVSLAGAVADNLRPCKRCGGGI